MQYFFPNFTYAPMVTMLLLAALVGLLAFGFVFKTRLFDVLLKHPLAHAYVSVPSMTLIFVAGFLAAQVWQNSDYAQAALVDENLALSRIYNAAIEPPELQTAVRKGVEGYAALVREKEWGENRNAEASPEVERAMGELKAMVRSVQATGKGGGTVFDLRRHLEGLEIARERRLELGSRSKFGYLSKWVLLHFMMLVAAVTVAAVHRANPRTAAIALITFLLSVALLFSMIRLYIHPYRGPGALPPALLVVK